VGSIRSEWGQLAAIGVGEWDLLEAHGFCRRQVGSIGGTWGQWGQLEANGVKWRQVGAVGGKWGQSEVVGPVGGECGQAEVNGVV